MRSSPALAQMGDAVDAEIRWPAAFGEIAAVMRQGGAAAEIWAAARPAAG